MGNNLFDALSAVGENILEQLLTSIEMTLVGGDARKLAEPYHLNGDDDAFMQLWHLTVKAHVHAIKVHEQALSEVDRCFDLLKMTVDVAPATPTEFGKPINILPDEAFQAVQVADISGRFVVFSDHHMLYDGARQNYFKNGYPKDEKKAKPRTRNYDLYLEVLNDYYGAKNFCLVENGDIEELLIYEPVIEELQVCTQSPDGQSVTCWSWDQVFTYRELKKLQQLPRIARDNRSYYETIAENFISKKKYFRLTGNHDRDMSNPLFTAIVKASSGVDLPLASDVLLLRGENGVECVICHGHQFDTSCTPKYAPYLGETLSMAGAWAYQGPDRVWREKFDPIDDWRSGRLPYRNELVSDEPDGSQTAFETFIESYDPVSGDFIGDSLQLLADAVSQALGMLDSERGWENLMGKNIAWEYFDSPSPGMAVKNEVKTGLRWYKFRHMNEFRIVGRMEAVFDDHPPRLILGHSHEPRFRPGFNLPGVPPRQVDFYINAASAGRFQNLLWGVELIDSEPTLISWHREKRPELGEVAIRTVWADEYSDSTYGLRAVSTATIAELLASLPDQDSTTESYQDSTTLRIAVDHTL